METALIVLAAANLALLILVLVLLRGSKKENVEELLRQNQEQLQSSLHAITAQQTEALGRVREEVRTQIAEGMNRSAERLATTTDTLREKVEGSLAKGREEQAASLQRTTEAMEAKFEGLRNNVETRLTQVSEKVNSSLSEGRKELTGGLDLAVKNLEQRFGELRQATEKKLVEIRGEVEKKLGETVEANIKHFDSVAQRLKDVHEATGQIVTLSKGINDLNVLLKAPKAQGAFGELTLEQMLKDLFGENTGLFELQYSITSTERVDAAIYLKPDKSQVLCVDSKFPLKNVQQLLDGEPDESTRKDLEKGFKKEVVDRATEISSKYIQPPKTADFAFMFVPAESVYYLLLRNTDLHQRLLRMRVIPTSPNSFFAYLQALSIAFRGMKIEEKSREIQKAISHIGKDFERFAEDFRVLGKHLESAYKRYGDSEKRIERFRRRVRGITHIELETGVKSPPQLESPPEVLEEPVENEEQE
jgi:DNA recombination protein RmuC